MQGTVTQISIGLGALVLYMVLYSYFQVYRRSSDSLNMIVGQVVSFFVLFLGMLSRMHVPDEDGYAGNSFTLAIILVGSIPIWFVLYTLFVSFSDIKAMIVARKAKYSSGDDSDDSDDEFSDDEVVEVKEVVKKQAKKGDGGKVLVENN